ncbi:MAG: type II secretion system protein GspC [Gammaproteobacteria bacterium]
MTSIGWNSPLTQALSGRLTQRLVPLINAGLVIAVAYSLTQLTWLAWPVPPIAGKAPVLRPSTASVAAPTGSVHASLAALHLFGEAGEQAAGAAPSAMVPQTPLQLTLKGVIASQDAHNARAIIADAAGKEDSYAVNAQLPGEAVLKEIYVDHVILTRNNQDEILALVKDSPGGSPGVNAALPGDLSASFPAGGDIQSLEAQGMSPGNAGGEPGMGITAQPADISATLRNYRDVLATNPQNLAGLAQAEPVQDGDKFKGYRIQPGSDPSLFSNLGFQPGDIVTAVNGITLDNPAKAFEIMQNLATAGELQVVVERNGESRTLSARINE